jgi:hypothetical protein
MSRIDLHNTLEPEGHGRVHPAKEIKEGGRGRKVKTDHVRLIDDRIDVFEHEDAEGREYEVVGADH